MGCTLSNEMQKANPNQIDLSHFELLKVVGRGGFGKVNAVTKIDSNELMAMKRMEKAAILHSSSQLKMVWTERKIMSQVTECPFLCHLEYAFQSERELFLVMPFMQGGDLRYHLKERGTMSESMCQFYAAQMVLGLEHLHDKKIVFRDLKPDNMLLDTNGNLRISDFGLAYQLTPKNNFHCIGQTGTRGYQAPEVLANYPYDTCADLWSFGCTIYELLHGVRPFRDTARIGIAGILQAEMRSDDDDDTGNNFVNNANIHHKKRRREEKIDLEKHIGRRKGPSFRISSKLSPETHDLLRSLLVIDPNYRLGCSAEGWETVKRHPFFAGIDWMLMAQRQVPPPIQPDHSRANCTADADLADQLLDQAPRAIRPEMQKLFVGWEFRTKISKTLTTNR